MIFDLFLIAFGNEMSLRTFCFSIGLIQLGFALKALNIYGFNGTIEFDISLT